MFIFVAGVVLGIAAFVIFRLLRAWQDAEGRAAHAESEAALRYSQGYQEGSAEQYTKLQRELETSHGKGLIAGYSTAIEDQEQPRRKRPAAA